MWKITIIIFLLGFISLAGYFFLHNEEMVYKANLAAIYALETSALKNWQEQGGLQHNLKMGSHDPDVRLVQNALLADTGVATSTKPDITGYFGKTTFQAVIAFQTENNIATTGMIDDVTRAKINSTYFNLLCPRVTTTLYPDLSMILVDKTHAVPADYVPMGLVDISGTIKTIGVTCLTQNAATALQAMFADASAQGIHLAVTSSYRRPEIQSLLHDYWLQYNYTDNIDKIAEPYHSEHQLGTAVDLTGQSINYNGVDPNFSASLEGQWLINNSYRFGFNQSYPALKSSVTGYDFEPWHFRYVGTVIATYLHDHNITYSEYLTENH